MTLEQNIDSFFERKIQELSVNDVEVKEWVIFASKKEFSVFQQGVLKLFNNTQPKLSSTLKNLKKKHPDAIVIVKSGIKFLIISK